MLLSISGARTSVAESATSEGCSVGDRAATATAREPVATLRPVDLDGTATRATAKLTLQQKWFAAAPEIQDQG